MALYHSHLYVFFIVHGKDYNYVTIRRLNGRLLCRHIFSTFSSSSLFCFFVCLFFVCFCFVFVCLFFVFLFVCLVGCFSFLFVVVVVWLFFVLFLVGGGGGRGMFERAGA